MIEVAIGLDGVPSPSQVVLGNKWENKDEFIHFNLPEDFDTYYKYVIGVMRKTEGDTTVVLPVTNNILTVSTALSQLDGRWNLYLMCRETEIVQDDSGIVKLAANENDEHIFISDGFIGTINRNYINKEDVGKYPEQDANIKTLYDELNQIKIELQAKIDGFDDFIADKFEDATQQVNTLTQQAKLYQDNAQTSAQTATEQASSASKAAQIATDAVTTISQSVTTAQQAATTATDKATEAGTFASQASSSVEQAAKSAKEATDSVTTVTGILGKVNDAKVSVDSTKQAIDVIADEIKQTANSIAYGLEVQDGVLVAVKINNE